MAVFSVVGESAFGGKFQGPVLLIRPGFELAVRNLVLWKSVMYYDKHDENSFIQTIFGKRRT